MFKELLKDLKPKYLKDKSKKDLGYFFYDHQNEIIDFYIKKGHKNPTEVNELFERMLNPKFLKGLKQVYKNGDKLDVGFAVVIGDFIRANHQTHPDLTLEYRELLMKILKKRIKKIKKTTGAPEDFLAELLVVIPEPEVVSNPRFLGIYVNKIARRLYALTKDPEGFELPELQYVRALFAGLFSEAMMNEVAISLLLERKEYIRHYNSDQIKTWNVLTALALDQLESNKKKEIDALMENYENRRKSDAKKNKDTARRIQFDQISEEDYPKITKVYKKRLSEQKERSEQKSIR